MTEIAAELSLKAERMSRFYATLSEANAAIIRCTEERELHTAICAVLADKGGFAFAAVACPDWQSRRAPIVACAGQIRLTNHIVEFDLTSPESMSLATLALATGETQTSGDIVADPRAGQAIRDMYARIGVHSINVVVIRRSGEIAAAMVIASAEKDFFTTEILGLIEDVGRNVSFALENFVREQERREAQKALRDSAQLYSMLVASAPVGIFQTDAKGRMIFANDALLQMSGISRDDILFHERWTAAYHPDDRDRVEQAWIEAMRTLTPAEAVTYRYLRPDGRQTWAHARAVPMLDEDGALRGFVGVVTDITTEREQLHRIEQLSRLYATLSRVNSIVVRAKDEAALFADVCRAIVQDGRFEQASISMADWEQRTLRQIQSCGVLATPIPYRTREMDDPSQHSVSDIALRGDSIAVVNDFLADQRISPRFREAARAVGMGSACAVPLRCEGRTIGTLSIASCERHLFSDEVAGLIEEIGRDLSFALENLKQAEQKRHAEAAVARSEQHLDVTLRSIGDAVLVTDTAGQVTLMNPVAEALTGWREDEARGHPASEVFRIVNQQTRLPVESPVDLVLENGVIVGLANHTVLIAKDGSERPIADSGAPIRIGEQGAISGVVLVFRDQSEEYRMQKALRDSEQLYSSLAQHVPVGICLADVTGELYYANEQFLRITGLHDTSLRSATTTVLHPDDRERIARGWAEAIDSQRGIDFGAFRYLHPDGRVVWAHGVVTPLPDEDGGSKRLIGVVNDITAEREQLRDIERLSRFNATLRQVNSAIVYCSDEQSLYASICRVFAGPGGFGATSIYCLDRGARRAELAVYCGPQENIARQHAESLPLDGNLWTLATAAILDGEAVVSDDLQNDARLPSQLRKAAVGYEMASGCALPLRCFGETIATLVLYSTERAYFRGEIVDLLHGIGRDVSHALEAIANRKRRNAAELAVAHSEERLRLGLSLTRTGMYEANYATGRVALDEVSAQLMNLGAEAMEADLDGFFARLAEHGKAGDGRGVTEDLIEGKRDSFSTEFAVSLPDGTVRWLRNYGALTAERTALGLPLRMLGVISDITAAKSLEERNRIAAAVFDTSGEAILITDASKTILLANQAFARMSGYAPEEIVGKRRLSLHRSNLHDDGFYAEIEETLQRDGIWQGEIWRQRRDDSVYPVLATVSLVRDGRGDPAHYVVQEIDISSQKEFEQRISRLAYRDPLTDLPNRTLLRDRVEQGIAAAHREATTLALLFLDLDHFKNINDSLGHAVGDRLLEEIARRLSACTREADTVGRLGGDEFLVLLPNADADAAAHVAQKLLQECVRPFVFGSHNLTVTPSVGIALYPKDGAGFDELLKTADTAMYRAKDEGRNAYRFYTPEMNQAVFQRMMLESSLRGAIDNGEFVLHYQPKFELRSRALIGAEALIRWHQPAMGMVSPAQFIPVAEESGLIEAIGKWVLEDSCRQIKAWHRRGLPPLRVAVNFSARQFAARNIAELVADALKKTGLPGSSLEMEITESLLAQDMDYTLDALQTLKRLGVHVAVDDFGTGYSSLSYLKRFPIDRLKIDQSFVRDLVSDGDDRAIATAVVTMGHSLGMRVIAEGVETGEQMDILSDMGCDEVQGYYLGRPIPADEMTAALEKFAAMPSHAA